MHYTLTQLADPNLSHSGFYVIMGITFLFSLVVFFIGVAEFGYTYKEASAFPICMVALLFLAAYHNSFNVKSPVPTNEPVTATLVSGYETVERTTGKYPHDVNVAYVIYKTPDGEVSFKREQGKIYPKSAILYRQTN